MLNYYLHKTRDAVVDDTENGEHEAGGDEWVFGEMIFYGIQYGTSSIAAVLINAHACPCCERLLKTFQVQRDATCISVSKFWLKKSWTYAIPIV